LVDARIELPDPSLKYLGRAAQAAMIVMKWSGVLSRAGVGQHPHDIAQDGRCTPHIVGVDYQDGYHREHNA